MQKLSLFRAFALWLITTLALLPVTDVLAKTYVNQTRLIINSLKKEGILTVINEGKAPVLIQAWTDRDNLLDRPEEIRMPFVILPPVFLLAGKSSRAIRIQALNAVDKLAWSQESLFWLNVLEVPPKASVTTTGNVMQMAFRTRIKLFFRPEAIASATLHEGVRQMKSSLVPCADATCLRLKSHSPLHITLLDVTLDKSEVIRALPNDGMISPFSTFDIPLPAGHSRGRLKSFTWIDDYGVANHFTR
ncbi:molecular chaperone [Silvania hatchlandensis]|uniref:Molecular chaperone n=1 Tax=Silvania hatchlandensis TaxID=2926469 RepID=A0A9J6Q145_9ENTR|nr:molecular chaperone [Silvania hatchlandensis]MCU6666295.1 molecular chaperone [Silvania hatchlandensis]